MTLASISSSSTAAAYCSPAVFQTRPTRRRDADEDDAAQASTAAQRSDGPGRRNPLVAAMMSALQSLMPTSASVTPKAPATAASSTTATSPAATSTTAAATTATPATTTNTADPATDLREAAYAFAHELYSALRGSGSGQGSGDSNNSDDGGEHHRHHHHHHRSEGSSGYGDLAQRLTALAQKLDGGSTAPAAAATPASAATPAAATTTSATPAAAAVTPAATPAATGTTINLTININLGGTAAAAPAPTAATQTASSPLIDAFKHLVEVLNPAGTAASTGPSPTERLSAFLRQMAQSLSSNRESDNQPTTPSSGSLLNVSA